MIKTIIILGMVIILFPTKSNATLDTICTKSNNACAIINNNYLYIVNNYKSYCDTVQFRCNVLDTILIRKWIGDSILFFETKHNENIRFFTYHPISKQFDYFKSELTNKQSLINASDTILKQLGNDSLYNFLCLHFSKVNFQEDTNVFKNNTVDKIDTITNTSTKQIIKVDTMLVKLTSNIKITSSFWMKGLPIIFSLLSLFISFFAFLETRKKTKIDEKKLNYDKKQAKPVLIYAQNITIKSMFSNDSKILPPYVIKNKGLGYAEIITMDIKWDGKSIFQDDKKLITQRININNIEHTIFIQRLLIGDFFRSGEEYIPVAYVNTGKDIDPMLNCEILKKMSMEIKYKSFYDEEFTMNIKQEDIGTLLS